MLDTEVLVVGAGPAGASFALNLAPFRRVVIVERRDEAIQRIGESLVPSARRLLSDMGLLASFLAEPHEPWYGNRAVWGDGEPHELDFLRDPDGHGWHLDRARFEEWLRETACARGAELLCPATLEKAERVGRRWRALLKTTDGPQTITSDLLVDASGRSASLSRKLGARAQPADKLICCWSYGRDEAVAHRGLTYVEAVEDGWWYTAPLPKGRRVLALHTDSDLPSAKLGRERLLERAGAVGSLSSLLKESGFTPGAEGGVTAAHSAYLEPFAGDDWMAVGDAAVSFDPLSSRGLFNALFTGLAAAEAAHSHLSGDALSLDLYAQTIKGIKEAYRRQLSQSYASETRWPESPFWRRRINLTYL